METHTEYLKIQTLIKLLLTAVSIPASFICTLPTSAQTLNYSGVIADETGQPLTGEDIGVEFHFFGEASGGSELFSIALNVKFDAGGRFSANLPLSSEQLRTIQDLHSAGSSLYVEVEVSDAKLIKTFARQEFGATPFALAVPVDNETITYDSQGRLKAISSSTTSTGSSSASSDSASSSWSGNSSSISTTAKVGIGTSSPARLLDIQNPSGSAVTNVKVGSTTGYAQYNLSNSGNDAIGQIFVNGTEQSAYGGANSLNVYQSLNAPLTFATNNTERMRISGAGKVGIGTTAPGENFHVVGNMRLDNAGQLNWGNGNTAIEGTTSSNYFRISTSNVERLRIDANGNVGIGTTNPGHTLHVVGTAGLSTGTTWTNASDLRLKDVQGDYDLGLEQVMKLHPVRFTYKEENPLGLPAGLLRTGFIAQEVSEVIPEAVTERDDGYLELNVDPIHLAVVNAVKELGEKNAKLESENAELRKWMAQLESKFKELVSLLCKSDERAENCHLEAEVRDHD